MNTIFIFEKEQTVIKCSIDDYIEDICNKFIRMVNAKKNEVLFLYKGKQINQHIKINEFIIKEDLKNNKINIFCFKIKYLPKDIYNKNKLKEIICPECGEICKIKFDDYKIKLYGCKNNHELKNIEFENFFEIQNIGKSKIKCDNCNKNEEIIKYNEYYTCLECNKCLCKFCKEIHDQKHNIIRYKDSYYICIKHKEKYSSYCKKCQINLCSKCEEEHKNKKSLIYYKEIWPDMNDSNKEEMKLKIEKFNNNIKNIIEKLNKTMNKINIYYQIYLSIINIYDIININYQILNNINNILNYNNKIILNEINEVIEEPDEYKNVNKLIDLYNLIFNINKNIIRYKLKNNLRKKNMI